MVALVYNCEIRNNGTGVLCLDGIRNGLGLGKSVKRYHPGGPINEEDLYIYIDDGRDDLTWECPKPNAYWAIDTHLGYDYRLWKSRQFDYVFTAQKEGAEKLRKDGIENVEWLPLACSPSAHPSFIELCTYPPEILRDKWGGVDGLTKVNDCVFVGHLAETPDEPGYNNRIKYLTELFEAFPNSWLAYKIFFEEMAVRYVRGKVGFNISIRNDLNMRFFEVMGIGTCLLTNTNVDGWDDIGYVEGEHFLGYTNIDEAIEKAKWAIDNSLEREAIATAGHQFTRDNHTYAHRMAHILDVAGIDF